MIAPPNGQAPGNPASLCPLAGRGLTFQLAADIIETSITTEWDALGSIAAVAIIRTFLNYFLDRDVAEVRERQRQQSPSAAPILATGDASISATTKGA